MSLMTTWRITLGWKKVPKFKGLLHKLSEDYQPRHKYRYAY